jgi:citrate lyase beta subunit
MPGDSLRKISKAARLDVDTIVIDLEDGVALANKEAARRTAVEALHTLDFGRRERLIRLNPPAISPVMPGQGPDLYLADLDATIDARADGYVIPKVEAADQLLLVSNYLDKAEAARGWPQASIRLLALIETARGVMNLNEIARDSLRLEALMFGAEDLAGDMGAKRTRAGRELFYARSAVVTAAAAYGLQAIDMILADLDDLDRLEEECLSARELGYEGKMAVHPRQLETINRVFTPSREEIERARWLIEAYERQQAAGSAVFELDGKMVEIPMIRLAERVLEKARAAGH